MFVITKRRLYVAGCVAAVSAIAGVGAVAAGNGGGAAPVTAPALDDGSSTTTATVLVFVSGEVVHPGLYRLSPDARVADAIADAGGLLPGADMNKLPDMAQRVHDGRQINVPPVKASARTAAAKLDVNTAALDELAAVPGMPAGLPQAIIQYRIAWGPFASLSDMRSALEIDPATMRAISPWLRVVI